MIGRWCGLCFCCGSAGKRHLSILVSGCICIICNCGDPSPSNKYLGLLWYWTECWSQTQNEASALFFLNKMNNNWLNVIELLHPFPHIPPPQYFPMFPWSFTIARAKRDVSDSIWREGEADGVLLVQTVLIHPPVKIIKLSKTEVNAPHGCLFCLQVKLKS